MAANGTHTAAASEGEAYWKQALDGAPQILEIVTDLPRVSPDPSAGARVHWAVNGAVGGKLQALAAGCGVSLSTVLLTAYSTLLARYSRGDDIVVGVPVAHTRDGRANTVAVRVVLPAKDETSDVQEGAAFRDLCRAVDARLKAAVAHADVSFGRVCEMMGSASASSTPVTQALFACAPAAGDEGPTGWATAAPLVTASLPSDFTVTHDLDLRVASVSEADGIVGCLYYRRDLFIKDSAEQMASALQVLLEGAAASPETPWHSLELLTFHGRTEILQQLNATEAEYATDACIHDLFLENAEKFPDRVAVVFLGQRFTYREIADRVNAVAQAIIATGVAPGSMVPILFERDVDCVVGIYGVLAARCAYVPVDSEYPADRMMHIIEQTGSDILVSHKMMAAKVPPTFSGHVINVDELQPVHVPGPHKRQQNPDSLVYGETPPSVQPGPLPNPRVASALASRCVAPPMPCRLNSTAETRPRASPCASPQCSSPRAPPASPRG